MSHSCPLVLDFLLNFIMNFIIILYLFTLTVWCGRCCCIGFSMRWVDMRLYILQCIIIIHFIYWMCFVWSMNQEEAMMQRNRERTQTTFESMWQLQLPHSHTNSYAHIDWLTDSLFRFFSVCLPHTLSHAYVQALKHTSANRISAHFAKAKAQHTLTHRTHSSVLFDTIYNLICVHFVYYLMTFSWCIIGAVCG